MASRTVKIGCPLLIFLVVVLIFISKDQTPSSRAPSSGKAILATGTNAPKVPVFLRPELIDEVARAGDDRVIAAMVLRGEAFLADQRCEVAVVDTAFGKRKVRILSPGPVVGMSGWVPAEWVK